MRSVAIFLITLFVSVCLHAEETIVTTFAGSGTAGAIDETGTKARFNAPSNIAVDSSGNVYVADTSSNRIRKIDTSGVVTTFAGSSTAGNADGTGSAAGFNAPAGVAVDSSGNVYVADTGNHSIRKITSAGVVTTIAGDGNASFLDANGTSAKFSSPTGIAVDGNGTLVYVADTGNNRIRKITTAGVVTTMAGSGATGSTDGNGGDATFYSPAGIATDTGGNLYVADTLNSRIRRVSYAGVVTTFAGSGSISAVDGLSTAASFNVSRGIAVDSLGNVYVADTGNNKIRKITQSGAVFTLAGPTSGYGSGYTDGPGTAAQFYAPKGIAITSAGIIYVSDTVNNRIRKIVTTKSNSSPTLSIYSDKNSTIKGGNINFISAAADSDGQIISYTWDFGDGTTSSSASPTHSFLITGTFNVSCTVMDNEGATVKKTIAVTVTAQNYAPKLSILYDKTSGNIPLTVSFISASSDADGNISSLVWNFGDGNSSNEANPTHTFVSGGDFNVTCTATDNNGLTAVSNIVISAIGPKIAPTLTLSLDKSVGTLPFTVAFSAVASTSNSGGSISSYLWSFGDGNSSSSQNTTHTFYTAGTYEVSCVVTDNFGLSATQKTTVVVSPKQASIQMVPGWNLVSIPVDKDQSDMSVFGNYSSIFIYDNATANYIKNPSILRRAQGFWVKMNESKSVTFSGNEYVPDISGVPSGWNLLGTGKAISNAMILYPSKTFFTFSTASNSWNQNPPVILPGQGFWVK